MTPLFVILFTIFLQRNEIVYQNALVFYIKNRNQTMHSTTFSIKWDCPSSISSDKVSMKIRPKQYPSGGIYEKN